MEIFVKGYWNSNLGDDLFLKTLCERYPNEKFNIVANKDAAITINKIPNLNITTRNVFDKIFTMACSRFIPYSSLADFDKEYRLAKKGNIICEIGGSIFKMPQNGMGYLFTQRGNFLNLNKPYVIIGSNFGPYFHKYQIEKYKKLFSKCYGVTFREKKSYRLFRDSGNIKFAPDVILSMKKSKKSNQPSFSNYILISVIDPFSRFNEDMSKRYFNYLISTASYYISKGVLVILMSFCKNEGDLSFAQKVAQKLHSKNVRVYNHRDINASLRIIQNAKKIIATRYHAMILGWLYRIPTFAICYDIKMHNVIENFFPNQTYLDIKELNNADYILPKFSVIKREKLDELIKSAQTQFSDLDNLVER